MGGERRLIDGNYGATIDIRLGAADTIVYLDLSRRLCLWRANKSRVQYARHPRHHRAPGCHGKNGLQFLRLVQLQVREAGGGGKADAPRGGGFRGAGHREPSF